MKGGTLCWQKCGCTGHGLWGIVVCKLCQWEEVRTIVLFVVDVYPEILLKYLVGALHLAIGPQVVHGIEVRLDPK